MNGYLIKDIRKVLINLNFNPTKVMLEEGNLNVYHKFYLSRQEEIKKFMKEMIQNI